jgi:outer membrane protein assembly factor BamB
MLLAATAAGAQSQRPAQLPTIPSASAKPAAEPERAFLFPLRIDYAIRLPEPPITLPAYDETRAFIATRPGHLLAVSLATGEILWSIDQQTTWPLVAGSDALFSIHDDTLDAFSPADGERLWTTRLETSVTSSLLWDAGWLAVCAGDQIIVLRGDVGHELWRRPLGARCSTRPAIAGDRLLVSLEDGRIAVLGLTDGVRVWERRLGGPVTEILSLGDMVYAGSRDNYFYALSAFDGRILWRWRTGADIVGDPLVDRSHVYFGSLDNVVRALDRRHGGQRWKQGLPIRPQWGPQVLDEIVVVSGLGPELRGFRASTGDAAGVFIAPSELAAPPRLVDGALAADRRVYVLTRDGDFLSLLHRIDPLLEPLEALPGTPSPIPMLPGVLPGLPLGRPLRVLSGWFLPGPVGWPPPLVPLPTFGEPIGLPPGPVWQPGIAIGFPPPLPFVNLPGRPLRFPPAPYWFEFRGIELGRPVPPESLRIPGQSVGLPPPPIRPRPIELPGFLLSPEPPPPVPPPPVASPVDGAEPIVAAPDVIPPP